ncbi:MAG: methyltransferase [Devosiaceae bacterium]|nr:methyltransferase [Devosiaceae bacterium MH13]
MASLTLSLRDRWFDWRDQLLQKPGFIQWASRFVLTRPVARKRTRELFDLAAGFVYTQILTACVRLELFEHLRAGPKTPEVLSQALDLPLNSAHTLLRAAVALELVEDRGEGRYGLAELGAALLANPGVVAMIRHHAVLYKDLQDPVALLRDRHKATALSAYWAYAQAEQPDGLAGDQVDDYSALMASSQDFICAEVLDAYPLSRHEHLLDVGGGEGRFVQAALERSPTLGATVFDLPAVAQRATARLGASGFGQRASGVGGDFFADSLPQGADIVSFIRVLHDHDDDKALALLRQARAALPVGGTVLIGEPMAQTPGAEKAGDAYFGFYLMAMRSGRPRSAAELGGFLGQAGFGSVREHATATPLLTRVLTARAL